MNNYKIGDRVYVRHNKFSEHELVTIISKEEFINSFVFSTQFTKEQWEKLANKAFFLYKSEIHKFLNIWGIMESEINNVISEDVYNSSLYKLMSEIEFD